ncbi:hypothetical protein [Burkholderia sp. Ax-1719]|uniref:hypothetical protein n=1 Tax=Burkholderia sp. Ax-1719 TaxID=2608334 RepID=UPI0014247C61|nr:hypothetical protein [Burkholderia sp. Ax-1719]NIE63051.1 hypothetical protein [Burkholderia sp. Ax-1719]
MSIYSHPPGDGCEVVHLEHWSIRQFENGKRFFVGYSQETRDGRVSAEIVDLDPATRIGRTASGRVYKLVGCSGINGDAEYVFTRVREIIGDGGKWKNVTEALIPECTAKVEQRESLEETSVDAAARILFVAPSYVRKLIEEEKLPARVHEDGAYRLPVRAVRTLRDQMRVEQKQALARMIAATDQMGLYKTEIEGLPVRRLRDLADD